MGWKLISIQAVDALVTLVACGPFHLHGLPLTPAWISNPTHYQLWEEIIYSLPNFNGEAVEIWGMVK